VGEERPPHGWGFRYTMHEDSGHARRAYDAFFRCNRQPEPRRNPSTHLILSGS
jgi:hypothetical protein